ncbi:MAG: APC family permease [Gammaproteobacteria bacterium]|nr:APC family permease [Gammaproteobacteria bacterium]
MSSQKTSRALSVFSLTMMTVGSVDSVRNLPSSALFGSQLIAFFILGAIFFLIPAALVSAELASAWPKQGGIYIWVREAFGKKIGFLAIWLQWIENVIWYPTLLSFVAGTIGYLISPDLVNDRYFLWWMIVGAFWATTLVNICGMKASAFVSNLCTLSGLLLPMCLIILLGIIWVVSGHVVQIKFEVAEMLPSWRDPSIWGSLTAFTMSFCGVEIATVHANDAVNPQRAFPIALAYSAIIILTTLILGSLAIAIVVPSGEINLVAGIMQAFHAFFAQYHLLWIMPAVALMLVLGGLGNVNNWVIAPVKGLLVAAEDGHLPSFLCKTNANDAPIVMLLLQAVIVTGLATLFLFFPTVNGAYWFLTALAVQLYMVMYVLMFAAAFKLRLAMPNHPRPFAIPGGWIGITLVVLMGIIGTVTTFCVSFLLPNGIEVGSVEKYELMLVAGLVVMCLVPFILSGIQQGQGRYFKIKVQEAV